jgi:hypothetical protein
MPETFDQWRLESGDAELRLILWAAWDPIGGVPRDEYDSYRPALWALIRDHARVLGSAPPDDAPSATWDEWSAAARASEERIAAQLGEWRTKSIGLPPDPHGDELVAAKLSDWLSPPDAGAFAPCDLPFARPE